MALTKTTTARPDGTTTTHFVHDGDESETVIGTGPIYGTVEVDGVTYKVNDDYIAVPTEHAGRVMHEIGLRHERDGHPMHSADGPDGGLAEPFVHICTLACGASARKAADIAAAYDDSLRRLGHDALIGTPEHKAFVARIKSEHTRHANLKTTEG